MEYRPQAKRRFIKSAFLKTHVRIALDQLNTRNKEKQFLELCLSLQQPFVIDNTNPSKAEREVYISQARARKFKVTGYYFQSKLQEAVTRNSNRSGKENIPEKGIKGTYNRLEMPAPEEGFDELFYVSIENDQFIIKEWSHEI